MKDLIDYLEVEKSFVSPKDQEKFDDWIKRLQALIQEPPKNKFTMGWSGSGVLGVVRCSKKRRSGLVHTYWTARFKVNGKGREKCYSINKYGEKEAFKLACIQRYTWTGALYVDKFAKLPCKPPVKFTYVL